MGIRARKMLCVTLDEQIAEYIVEQNVMQDELSLLAVQDDYFRRMFDYDIFGRRYIVSDNSDSSYISDNSDSSDSSDSFTVIESDFGSDVRVNLLDFLDRDIFVLKCANCGNVLASDNDELGEPCGEYLVIEKLDLLYWIFTAVDDEGLFACAVCNDLLTDYMVPTAVPVYFLNESEWEAASIEEKNVLNSMLNYFKENYVCIDRNKVTIEVI